MVGNIRIIGGKFKGRKLLVPNTNVRPTPNRVRETVFNWLMPYIKNARCLDLFAGSGALGFEALSRGAEYVEFVDINWEVIANLRAQQEILQLNHTECIIRLLQVNGEFSDFSRNFFAIVFLDPPFNFDLRLLCRQIEHSKILAPTAYIYLEAGIKIDNNDIPANWRILKYKHTGAVFYHLVYRTLHESTTN